MTVSDQGTKQKVSFREGVKTAVLDIGITWVVKTGQATDEMDGQTVQVCVPATAAALATPRAKRRRAVTPAECPPRLRLGAWLRREPPDPAAQGVGPGDAATAERDLPRELLALLLLALCGKRRFTGATAPVYGNRDALGPEVANGLENKLTVVLEGPRLHELPRDGPLPPGVLGYVRVKAATICRAGRDVEFHQLAGAVHLAGDGEAWLARVAAERSVPAPPLPTLGNGRGLLDGRGRPHKPRRPGHDLGGTMPSSVERAQRGRRRRGGRRLLGVEARDEAVGGTAERERLAHEEADAEQRDQGDCERRRHAGREPFRRTRAAGHRA